MSTIQFEQVTGVLSKVVRSRHTLSETVSTFPKAQEDIEWNIKHAEDAVLDWRLDVLLPTIAELLKRFDSLVRLTYSWVKAPTQKRFYKFKIIYWFSH